MEGIRQITNDVISDCSILVREEIIIIINAIHKSIINLVKYNKIRKIPILQFNGAFSIALILCRGEDK